VLTAPFVFPALWGMQRFAARECLRYQITSQRLRIKHEGKELRSRDIVLADVRDAALECPASLKATNLCNVELYGHNRREPLAVLEGIPLAESALVISLCEAAAHRHLPLRARERLLADAKAQEEELLRRAEDQHRQEVAALRGQIQALSAQRFIPPPPVTRRRPRRSGVADWLFGPKMQTVIVREHLRKGRLVRSHSRRVRA
jgi:hypothetical protein